MIYPFLVWSRVVKEHSTFLSISWCLREQVKLLQRRKGNLDNDFVPNIVLSSLALWNWHGNIMPIANIANKTFPFSTVVGMKSFARHLSSTIMVKFYEKLWLLKKITNYWNLIFLLLIAPKRGWHLCILRCQWDMDCCFSELALKIQLCMLV